MAMGPTTGKFFSDHGATVVRVESVQRLDMVRMAPPYKDGKVGVNTSSIFTQYNSGKYSIALDMSRPEARRVARRLVQWADVVIENFTPGVMARWGLDYEQVRQLNPSAIMVSLSNMGQTGPNAHQPGAGPTMVALAGLTHLLGWPDREPANPFGALSDFIAPRFAAAALLAALDHRRRTGLGQHLDLSQYETTALLLAPALLDKVVNGREAQRAGNRDPRAAPHGVFPCQGDDRWCAVAVFTQEQWHALCRVMGREDLASDPRFCSLERRKANEEALESLLAAWTAQHDAKDVMRILQANGVPAGVVNSPKDLYEDPQLAHRRHFWLLDHPEMGPHHHEGHAFLLSKHPFELGRAPLLGEHTELVLKQFLDMSDAEYQELRQAGVLE